MSDWIEPKKTTSSNRAKTSIAKNAKTQIHRNALIHRAKWQVLLQSRKSIAKTWLFLDQGRYQ